MLYLLAICAPFVFCVLLNNKLNRAKLTTVLQFCASHRGSFMLNLRMSFLPFFLDTDMQRCNKYIVNLHLTKCISFKKYLTLCLFRQVCAKRNLTHAHSEARRSVTRYPPKTKAPTKFAAFVFGGESLT